MPDASLKIIISADGTQASGELRKVGTAVEQTTESVKRSKQTFEVYNTALNQSSAYAKTAADIELKQAKALEELRASAEKAKQALANGVPAAVQLAGATTAVGVAAKATGADLVSAGNGVEKFLGGARSAFSAIRQLAYILPGIGIAGIFNLAFEAISNLVGAAVGIGMALKRQQSSKRVWCFIGDKLSKISKKA